MRFAAAPLIGDAPRDGGLVAWELLSGLVSSGVRALPAMARLAGHRVCLCIGASWQMHASAACSALSRRRRPTVTQFPVTRCQICQRTVACRPGALSQTLTDDYRRVHPERWASPPSNTRITRPGEGRTRSCP